MFDIVQLAQNVPLMYSDIGEEQMYHITLWRDRVEGITNLIPHTGVLDQ